MLIFIVTYNIGQVLQYQCSHVRGKKGNETAKICSHHWCRVAVVFSSGIRNSCNENSNSYKIVNIIKYICMIDTSSSR